MPTLGSENPSTALLIVNHNKNIPRYYSRPWEGGAGGRVEEYFYRKDKQEENFNR